MKNKPLHVIAITFNCMYMVSALHASAWSNLTYILIANKEVSILFNFNAFNTFTKKVETDGAHLFVL